MGSGFGIRFTGIGIRFGQGGRCFGDRFGFFGRWGEEGSDLQNAIRRNRGLVSLQLEIFELLRDRIENIAALDPEFLGQGMDSDRFGRDWHRFHGALAFALTTAATATTSSSSSFSTITTVFLGTGFSPGLALGFGAGGFFVRPVENLVVAFFVFVIEAAGKCDRDHIGRFGLASSATPASSTAAFGGGLVWVGIGIRLENFDRK